MQLLSLLLIICFSAFASAVDQWGHLKNLHRVLKYNPNNRATAKDTIVTLTNAYSKPLVVSIYSEQVKFYDNIVLKPKQKIDYLLPRDFPAGFIVPRPGCKKTGYNPAFGDYFACETTGVVDSGIFVWLKNGNKIEINRYMGSSRDNFDIDVQHGYSVGIVITPKGRIPANFDTCKPVQCVFDVKKCRREYLVQGKYCIAPPPYFQNYCPEAYWKDVASKPNVQDKTCPSDVRYDVVFK